MMGAAVMSKLLSSTDLRVIIYDGNGHVPPARKMKFEFDHTFGHPSKYVLRLSDLLT